MRMFSGASVRRADQIVSNSLGTARRLEAVYERRVAAVVQPGITETIRATPAAEVRSLLKKYGIDKPYLLSVGTLEPRKGLDRLVPAFEALQESQLKDHYLVITGERGWKDNEIARLLSSNKRIRRLGFVGDDALSALYTGSDAFIFPSSYEGFGMPVLEARACGAQVVTTDIPELREAGGEDAIYVPPTVEGVHDGILKALRSSRCGPLNRAEHSWVKSAGVFSEVLTETPNCQMVNSA
jgi:glycosyltransferase involved in cell wall biosynthesis